MIPYGVLVLQKGFLPFLNATAATKRGGERERERERQRQRERERERVRERERERN